VYPPMFYASELHYCDQLTDKKPISQDLLPLPEYLYLERSLPDIVLVPAPYIGAALENLAKRHEGEVYHMQKAFREPWQYTNKPEIVRHQFEALSSDWRRYPGMVVLARETAPAAVHKVLLRDHNEAGSRHRLGMIMSSVDQFDDATNYFAAAIEADPSYAVKYIELGKQAATMGLNDQATALYVAVLMTDSSRIRDFLNRANLLTMWGTPQLAIPYYQSVMVMDKENTTAHVGLGTALWKCGNIWRAERSYRKALEIDPNLPSARAYLGRIMAAAGKKEEAVVEYQKALQLLEEDSPLAKEIRDIIKHLQSQ
jgi:tetratricopeptide (TPR) repeat protein